MSPTHLPPHNTYGTSDALTYTCTCPASLSPTTTSSPEGGGLVLLFYRYFTSTPPLPTHLIPLTLTPHHLAALHTDLTSSLNLTGKIRIAKEGFNVTVGGARAEVEEYMRVLVGHWSFEGLGLGFDEVLDEGERERREREREEFFKPQAGGCACVFGLGVRGELGEENGKGKGANVQVKSEITPMGVTNYLPANWEAVESLSPEEFHMRCWEDDSEKEGGKGKKKILIDVRNHYESRIGYFVNPVSGEAAVRPAIRRFSQWPGFAKMMFGVEGEMRDELDRNGTGVRDVMENGEEGEGGRQIMTYCTGGIRCEKGVRWMQENMQKRDGDVICTLKGGIAAYLSWMDTEILAGHKLPSDSLFKGKNYVFDARGSMGLSAGSDEIVSTCHGCGRKEDRLSKCRSEGCHLVLVVCEGCEEGEGGGLRCCGSCGEGGKRLKEVCGCEREREAGLWRGGEQVKLPRGRKKKGKTGVVLGTKIDVRFKTID